jgi:hypothetical protein
MLPVYASPTYLGFPPNFATPAAFNTATTKCATFHRTTPRVTCKRGISPLGRNWDVRYVGEQDVGLMILADAFSVVYDLPFGRGHHFNRQNRALDLIAGGWALNVINAAT